VFNTAPGAGPGLDALEATEDDDQLDEPELGTGTAGALGAGPAAEPGGVGPGHPAAAVAKADTRPPSGLEPELPEEELPAPAEVERELVAGRAQVLVEAPDDAGAPDEVAEADEVPVLPDEVTVAEPDEAAAARRRARSRRRSPLAQALSDQQGPG
jgi:hypothetical protein